MKYAAIDIGSNAIRLLIIESVIDSKSSFYFKKISLARVPIRLGKDVFTRGFVSKDNVLNLIDSVNAFKLLMKVNNVSHFRACATSAMREAINKKEVCDEIYKNTGIEIEVISGSEEAKLIFINFNFLDLDKAKNYVLIDVGGGSTELTLIEKAEKIAAKSFKIGSVRQLEKQDTCQVIDQMKQWVKNKISKKDNIIAVGTGGSINKLYSLSNHEINAPMSLIEMIKTTSLISSYNYQDRIRVLKLKPDRADVIVPSSELYQMVMKAAGANEIIVPKFGLADGIIFEMFMKYENK
jgi:exopolyphosphatase / guanosine-5'-triphosphate,3'-diphosphate pyrophosphatase